MTAGRHEARPAIDIGIVLSCHGIRLAGSGIGHDAIEVV